MSENADGAPEATALTTIGGHIGELVASVTLPARLVNNVCKALGRLSTAAVDVPVAWLEGRAAEQRAETAARVKLLKVSSEQLAKQLEVDPAYVQAAGNKFAHRIIREQVNLDAIAEEAAKQIKQDTENAPAEKDKEKEVPPISDDWLNQFENQARQVTSEEMRRLFGRVLAGEIQKPSSYSIRTVKVLGEMDKLVAERFRRLCSLSISLRTDDQVFDARVASLGGNAASNALQQYGLSFDQLNMLQEHDLIITDYNSWMDYQAAIANENKVIGCGITYAGRLWGLIPQVEGIWGKELRVPGVRLSYAGKQLLGIVDVVSDDAYTAALVNYFESMHVKMVRVSTRVNASNSPGILVALVRGTSDRGQR